METPQSKFVVNVHKDGRKAIPPFRAFDQLVGLQSPKLLVGGSSPSRPVFSDYGGTGRHARFRLLSRKGCGFESHFSDYFIKRRYLVMVLKFGSSPIKSWLIAVRVGSGMGSDGSIP